MKVNIFYILRFSYTSFINKNNIFPPIKAHIKLTRKLEFQKTTPPKFKSKMHPNKIKNNQKKLK